MSAIRSVINYLLSNKTCLLGVLQVVSMSLGHPAIHRLLDPCNIINIAINHQR
jgi:hypothetical protein